MLTPLLRPCIFTRTGGAIPHIDQLPITRRVADPRRLLLWATTWPEDSGLHDVHPPDAWAYR